MTETKIFSDQNYLNKEKICKNVSFNWRLFDIK
jgi:hypothetical protein